MEDNFLDKFDISFLNLPEDKENNLLVISIKDKWFPKEYVSDFAKRMKEITDMKILVICDDLYEVSIQTKEQIIEYIKNL